MLRILEREMAGVDQRLVLVAPPNATIPRSLHNVTAAPGERDELIGKLQRLRGGIYLRDGALCAADLTSDGRHQTPEDDRSWHLVVMDDDRRIHGCIWYMEHQQMPDFHQLRMRDCALTKSDEWGGKLQSAVEREIARAQRERIRYAEVGGWAVECGARCFAAGLLLILGTYSLSQLAGGALVIATATVRHSSAKILRRLGGSQLEGDGYVVPSYYDPRYECDMELLRFDTRKPTRKYAGIVNLLRAKLASVEVVASEWQAAPCEYQPAQVAAMDMVAA